MKKINSKIYNNIWLAAGFLAIALLFLRKVIFSGDVAMSVTGDSYLCIYSWGHYFIWALKQGIFPLWNSLNLCGHPFGTEAPSNFNILNLLNLFLHPDVAWNVRFILCIFLAGYFMFLYARSISVSVFSSFVCGIVYMFTNCVVDVHLHTTTFMLPLIFLSLEKAVSRRRYTYLALSAVITSLYYLNSNPQFFFYVFVFLCAYIIYRCRTQKEHYSNKTIVSFLAIFIWLSFTLTAVQISRTIEITQQSSRVILKTWYFIMLPSHLITGIFPYIYESPFRGEFSFFLGRTWLEVVKKLPALLGNPGIAQLPYIGVAPLILAMLAFLKRHKGSIEQFFGWSALTVVIYMSTSFLSHIIIRHIPILNQWYQISRAFIVYDFSLALLAGCGMDVLLYKNRNTWQYLLKRMNAVILSLAAGIGMTFGIAHVFLIWKKESVINMAWKLIQNHIANNPAYAAPLELYRQRIVEFYNALCAWTNLLDKSFYISALIIIFTFFIFYAYIKNKIKKEAFAFLIIFVILADLFFIMTPKVPFSTGEEIIPRVKAADFLSKQQGIFRVLPLQDIRDLAKPMDPKTFLRCNTNLIYGINTPEGIQSIIIKRYADLMMKSAGKEMTGLIGEVERFNQRIANLMNIKYVVTSLNRQMDKPFKLVYEDKQHRVWENLEVLPRAFVVYERLILSENKEILKALFDEKIPLEKTVILEEEPKETLKLPQGGYSLSSQARIEKYSPHSLRINVDMKNDGFLVLSECFFPGWHAHVDGKQKKIYRADYVFRAIALPQGSHEVLFIYKPVSVKLGLIFMFLGILSIIVIIAKERNKGNG